MVCEIEKRALDIVNFSRELKDDLIDLMDELEQMEDQEDNISWIGDMLDNMNGCKWCTNGCRECLE